MIEIEYKSGGICSCCKKIRPILADIRMPGRITAYYKVALKIDVEIEDNVFKNLCPKAVGIINYLIMRDGADKIIERDGFINVHGCNYVDDELLGVVLEIKELIDSGAANDDVAIAISEASEDTGYETGIISKLVRTSRLEMKEYSSIKNEINVNQ